MEGMTQKEMSEQSFIPLKKLDERIERDMADSSSAGLNACLYAHEFLIKLVCSVICAGIKDDVAKTRYRLEYDLVRADGIGDWSAVIEKAINGAIATNLDWKLNDVVRELSVRVPVGDWRHKACENLEKAFEMSGIQHDPLPTKVNLLWWFRGFAEFRNKTRGHGALPICSIDSTLPFLKASYCAVAQSLSLFRLPYAYLHCNYSGRYRVVDMGNGVVPFGHLKGTTGAHYDDGLYVALDVLRKCSLIYTSTEADDFFFPNGNYTPKTFEVLSYITGETQRIDSVAYRVPVDALPRSETDGMGQIDVQGNVLGNLPAVPTGYVERSELEDTLTKELLSVDRHPIVTLSGRGGIGKTSAALQVLWKIAKSQECPYDMILWFSSRDIDLKPEGAKFVRPNSISRKDFAQQFFRLVQGDIGKTSSESCLMKFAEALSSDCDGKMLFVFDNFETVASPQDLFSWLEQQIRLPNKILITTRFRGKFRADYPIEVKGMSEEESGVLIHRTAERFKTQVSSAQRTEIIIQSDGHPYVIKVMIGEIIRNPHVKSVGHVMARREDILNALFERSYAALGLAAKRLFLTLSSWNSLVMELAVEAVLVRPGSDLLDVCDAIEELEASSMIERIRFSDDIDYLGVPLMAQIFGKKKLDLSSLRGVVMEDVGLLHEFGVAQKHDIGSGVNKRLQFLFANIAKSVAMGSHMLEEFAPIIEYVARKLPQTWLYMADLCEELNLDVEPYLKSYLESDGCDDVNAWKRIIQVYRKKGQYVEELNALAQMAKLKVVSVEMVSNAANHVNFLIATFQVDPVKDGINVFIREIAEVLYGRRKECSATDLSRLAWLYINLKKQSRAEELVDAGLRLDPQNIHCLQLQERINEWQLRNE